MILLHVFEKVVSSEGRPHSSQSMWVPTLETNKKPLALTLHFRQSFSHLGKTVVRECLLSVLQHLFTLSNDSLLSLSLNNSLLFPSLFTLTPLIRFTPFFRATFIYPLRLISRPRNCRDLNH
jgi:hypothetical protein